MDQCLESITLFRSPDWNPWLLELLSRSFGNVQAADRGHCAPSPIRDGAVQQLTDHRRVSVCEFGIVLFAFSPKKLYPILLAFTHEDTDNYYVD